MQECYACRRDVGHQQACGVNGQVGGIGAGLLSGERLVERRTVDSLTTVLYPPV